MVPTIIFHSYAILIQEKIINFSKMSLHDISKYRCKFLTTDLRYCCSVKTTVQNKTMILIFLTYFFFISYIEILSHSRIFALHCLHLLITCLFQRLFELHFSSRHSFLTAHQNVSLLLFSYYLKLYILQSPSLTTQV